MDKQRSATFSTDRKYRYRLYRVWDDKKPVVLFIGLNPSTADEIHDDPTVRRCIGFAKLWNYGGMIMGNIFSYRSTDPSVLAKIFSPVGTDNDVALQQMYIESGLSVACWGSNGILGDRGREVANLLPKLKCFGITVTRQPLHPLYLPYSSELIDLPDI